MIVIGLFIGYRISTVISTDVLLSGVRVILLFKRLGVRCEEIVVDFDCTLSKILILVGRVMVYDYISMYYSLRMFYL